MDKKTMSKQTEVKLPCGQLCGRNCVNGCIYWCPNDRDKNGRQYCSYRRSYYFPKERHGCFNYKRA